MDRIELWLFTFIDIMEDIAPYMITGVLSVLIYQLIGA
jgi:hypothetical protein